MFLDLTACIRQSTPSCFWTIRALAQTHRKFLCVRQQSADIWDPGIAISNSTMLHTPPPNLFLHCVVFAATALLSSYILKQLWVYLRQILNSLSVRNIQLTSIITEVCCTLLYEFWADSYWLFCMMRFVWLQIWCIYLHVMFLSKSVTALKTRDFTLTEYN